MFETPLASNLIIREILNGSLFPLCINLSLVIGIFLVTTYLEAKESSESWWTMPGVPTGCALFWVFLLESVRAFSVWIILRTTNDGRLVPEWVRDWTNVSLIAAAAFLVVTMLRCTYLFTPPRWGNSFWIYSIMTTIAFLVLSHMVPHGPGY